jgi:prepilin-type N-terminal cleavage/methylation domain-containing protein
MRVEMSRAEHLDLGEVQLNQTNNKGFTLVETLLTVSVMGVLIAVAVYAYRGYIVQSESVELLNSAKALELEIRAPANYVEGLKICNDALVNAENLQSRYADLSIQAIPNDPLDPLSEKGFGAALRVTTTLDKYGTDGIAVATTFFEEAASNFRAGPPQGLITDSVVTFDLLLSESGQPYCQRTGAVAAAGGPSASPTPTVDPALRAINRPPVASNSIDLGATAEDTALPIDISKLLKGCYDPDGDSLSITGVSSSAGKITGDASSGFTFQPAQDFNGQDVKIEYEVSDGIAHTKGSAVIDVTPVVDPPQVNLTVTATQEVLRTGTQGRAVIPAVNTGGDMRAMSLEFSVVGHSAGSATAGSGPVIFNYGTSTNNNLISAWRPNNLNIAFFGTGYDTGIDLTDGASHRLSITWSSATGELKIFDNGVLVRTHTGVAKGQVVPGSGYAVIGQKMNNPATQDGWNTGEHYDGQIFGVTMLNQARTDSLVAQQPMYVSTAAEGLIMDVRSQAGRLQDALGNRLNMQGDFDVQTMPVDTALALVPPGSTITLNVQATVSDADSTIQSIKLSGLPGGAQISDSSGKTGSGDTDISGWNLSNIKAKLPNNIRTNLSISVIATAAAPDGSTAQATAMQTISLKP